ncbi:MULTISPECIES: nuclear transport factor 2 family protein [Rhodococcus]|uniref:Possible ketosteroid isomerase-related protein n=1 Tax=Rhodococcus jostii (strain RHA1) TaxID=101510 RepID=Q0RWK4_RHOJR|nr:MULTISPECIES: nuclear transport factor 2 family protein [Rhodococcus]ABH00332.1 possible ketosteroid isomerase-related protein [Rhodococcus jostii RHA1]
MSTKSNEMVVRGAIDAITRGDWDALGEFIAADNVTHFPGLSPLAGDHQGIGALQRRIVELTGSGTEIDVQDVLASDDHAVGIYRLRAHRDGKSIEWQHVNVYQIRDGKIVEVWQHPFEQDLVDDFFSQESGENT